MVIATVISLVMVPHARWVVAEEPTEQDLGKWLRSSNIELLQKALVQLERDDELCNDLLADLIEVAGEQLAVYEKNRQLVISEVTIRLVEMIGRSDQPQAVDLLVTQLKSSRPDVVMLAATALGKNDRREAIDDLMALIEHPSFDKAYGFRFSVLRAISRIDDPRCLDFLIAISPRLDGQLEVAVDGIVSELLKKKFQRDQQRREGSQQPVSATSYHTITEKDPEYHDPRYGRPQQQADYYGIGIYAKRLVFVIDCSTSMSERVYEQPRLWHAKHELIKTINALQPTTSFNIVAYGTDVTVWKPRLAPAEFRSKRSAVRFVESLVYSGSTNTYGALRRALTLDSNLEAVFLLSDGAPTCGDIVAPAAIVHAISHQNLFCNVAINTIGIGIRGDTQLFMQNLASKNGGEYRDTN